jgi:hypothetical protein
MFKQSKGALSWAIVVVEAVGGILGNEGIREGADSGIVSVT